MKAVYGQNNYLAKFTANGYEKLPGKHGAKAVGAGDEAVTVVMRSMPHILFYPIFS